MSGDTVKDEYSKDLEATYKRNTKPVTITLTAIEVFAIVSAVQVADGVIPESSSLGKCAKDAAKKMQDCMDSNSLLYKHLNESWDSETSNIQSSGNFLKTSPTERFTS